MSNPGAAPPAAKQRSANQRGANQGRANLDNNLRLARPKVAVDTVVFAVEKGRLKTYLVELRGPVELRGALKFRGEPARRGAVEHRGAVKPGSPAGAGRQPGKWAFPGGLVRVGELLDDAARRELEASTGLRGAYLEQLFTFGDPSRDPREHVVSVAYMALISSSGAVDSTSPKYARGDWFEVAHLPPLAYDHSLMAAYAFKRLKSKLEYTNIAYALLPEVFTFAELEELYATILERPLDRRNFRRRILAMGLLTRLPATRRGAHRPAALYRFARQSLQFIEML
ncbi:MAG TPA: NUDIX domain-containing protein [Candidatus Binataceae bacterium]